MGSSPSKNIIEGKVIETFQTLEADELLWPTNPGNDKKNTYYWKLIPTSSSQFTKIQEEGYIIATNLPVKPEPCFLWLRKKRTNKI